MKYDMYKLTDTIWVKMPWHQCNLKFGLGRITAHNPLRVKKNIWTIPNVSENIDDASFMNEEAIILRDFIAYCKAVVSDAVRGKKHITLKEDPSPSKHQTQYVSLTLLVRKKKKKKEWCWWHCNHLTNETMKTTPSCSGDKMLLNSHIQQKKNSCNFWTIYQHWTLGLFVLWKMGLDNLLAFEFVTQWACLWIFVFVCWTNFSTIGIKCNPF